MTEKKLKVKFTETHVVDDCHKGTKQEKKYSQGKTYALVERSAMHFVSRGKAVLTGNSAS